MNKDELKKFVTENPKLVSMKLAGEGMYVLKYKKSVFFDNLWNDFLEECRGTIVDADFNVISRPFTKIYNYGIESRAPKLAEDVAVDVYRKINGFMVAVTWHNGDILVSTTGSVDSPYVAMARELIDLEIYRKVCAEWPNTTFMFECVHRNDPHIVPETEGMYLLGYRAKNWENEVRLDPKILAMFTIQFNTLPVEHFESTVGEVQKLVKSVKHEGFVFYAANGDASKIKSPYYLINKFVARNPRTDKLMRSDIKNSMDEEYYPLIDAIQADIAAYTSLDEQARLVWVRKFLEAQ